MLIFHLLYFFFSIVGIAQTQPTFKGGQKDLFSFISNNMIYPEYSKQNCLQGTINVSFSLNKYGQIYKSEIQKGFGTDLDDEALRIVRLTSGRWVIPADYDSSTSIVLPINFTLKNYSCESRSKDDLKNAISAYRSRLDLTRAVYNFYDKKANGQTNTLNELEIIALKNELGYNEAYITRLYKQALRKLKQGDKESACEDFNSVRLLGSNMADKTLKEYCQ